MTQQWHDPIPDRSVSPEQLPEPPTGLPDPGWTDEADDDQEPAVDDHAWADDEAAQDIDLDSLSIGPEEDHHG